MPNQLTLSRYKLTTFLACQRQFRVRYLDQLPWPAMPLDDRGETAVTRGHAFHQLVQRHYLGLTINPNTIDDGTLRRWWTIFNTHPPSLPQGQLLPEMSLTVPIDDFLLNGRFDLLIKGKNEQGTPFMHLFDWKTGKPQTESDLRHDWQTRLYLAMLAEGQQALWAADTAPLTPENIAITYWYVQEPDAPRTIQYSTTVHKQNWHDLQQILAQISTQLVSETWPRTEDLSHCQRCAYQAFCGRQDDGLLPIAVDENSELETAVSPIEPNSP
ncbi:MAG: PD-(D/E)XK nuclease family protein [Chloroflexi bacterium]|nr:PD-(D/E)XK nuclease family protein [Chloroflexota bacterium]